MNNKIAGQRKKIKKELTEDEIIKNIVINFMKTKSENWDREEFKIDDSKSMYNSYFRFAKILLKSKEWNKL